VRCRSPGTGAVSEAEAGWRPAGRGADAPVPDVHLRLYRGELAHPSGGVPVSRSARPDVAAAAGRVHAAAGRLAPDADHAGARRATDEIGKLPGVPRAN